MSVIPTGASKGSLGNLEVFGCSKICFLLYLLVELQNYEVWIAGKIIAQIGSKLLQLASRSKFLQLGSRSKYFNLDPDPSCFNLDLGTYCTLPSKIFYNPNTLLWHTSTYCANSLTQDGLTNLSAFFFLFLSFTWLKVGFLDLLIEVIPIIKSCNLLK